jgi:signal transduction histidine kinase
MRKYMLFWLARAPARGARERNNAMVMQIVLIALGIALPIAWLGRVGTPADWRGWLYPWITLAAVALAWISLALIRAGFLRFSSVFFLIGILGLTLWQYSALGLSGQSVSQIVHLFPLLLAGIVLGRGALWWTFLFTLFCLLCGALHDIGASGYQADALALVVGKALALGGSFLVVTLIIDIMMVAMRLSTANPVPNDSQAAPPRREADQDEHMRTQAMAQLIQGQRMKAIGQLAGGVAHDFNNILGVILGYVQRRQRYTGPEQLREALAGVEDAARRGAAVSRKLLSLSRQEVYRREVFDAGEALCMLEGMLRQLFDPRVRVEVDAVDTNLLIRFDRGQFELAVLNIATNARDAMRKGGRFRATARLASGNGAQPWVEIALSDSGQGMSQAVRERIFEPFFHHQTGGRGLRVGACGCQQGGRRGRRRDSRGQRARQRLLFHIAFSAVERHGDKTSREWFFFTPGVAGG